MFRALGAVPMLREWHGRVKDRPQELDDVQTTMSLLFSLAMCFANAFAHWFWAMNQVPELPESLTEKGGTYFGVILYTYVGGSCARTVDDCFHFGRVEAFPMRLICDQVASHCVQRLPPNL